MSSSVCLRRLSKIPTDAAVPSSMASRCLLKHPRAESFSTSTARYANPTPKKGVHGAPKKGMKTLNVKRGKKDAGRDTAKRPAIGERKALRKRIVLSNTNALEVQDLHDLNAKNVTDENITGQVMGIPGEVVDSLRAVEAFKTTQGWHLFRRPASLMRKETAELAQLVKRLEEGKGKETIRRVLVGDRMSGKTTLLLQAMTMAFLKKWVVINLPDAKDLIIGHTEYAPLPGSQPTQYTQDVYTANLLSQIAKANAAVLSKLKATTKATLPIPIPPETTLQKLAETGAANPDAAWPIFVALWEELQQPGCPPIMLAIDGLGHAMCNTQYLSADAKPIHAHDLTLIRHFVDHLSGKSKMANGGMVLAGSSNSNQPLVPAMDFQIQVAEARARDPKNVPQWNPYKQVDGRVMECLKDVELLRLNGIGKEEARAIMEYYAASGMLRRKVDESLVGEKWALAGAGNMGELERAAVRLRL